MAPISVTVNIAGEHDHEPHEPSDADTQHRIVRLLQSITHSQEIMLMNQSDLADKLNTVSNTLDKIATESAGSLDAIADLKAQLAASVNVSPELQAAVDRLE